MVETLEIKVIGTRYDPGAWVDAYGNRWTVGEVTPNGHIVGVAPGTFIAAGTVYIDEEDLPDALEAGWRLVGETAPNGLVTVEREYRGSDDVTYIRDPEHPERLPTAYSL